MLSAQICSSENLSVELRNKKPIYKFFLVPAVHKRSFCSFGNNKTYPHKKSSVIYHKLFMWIEFALPVEANNVLVNHRDKSIGSYGVFWIQLSSLLIKALNRHQHPNIMQ